MLQSVEMILRKNSFFVRTRSKSAFCSLQLLAAACLLDDIYIISIADNTRCVISANNKERLSFGAVYRVLVVSFERTHAINRGIDKRNDRWAYDCDESSILSHHLHRYYRHTGTVG